MHLHSQSLFHAAKAITTLIALLLSFSVSAFEVPLNLDSKSWQSLSYNKIPSNEVKSTKEGLEIIVKKSASPLIYVFDQVQSVSKVQIEGKMSGLPIIPKGKQQGDKGADDFPFRIGLVLAGDKTLGPAKKLFAPKWVKTLFKLAPEGKGIDHIAFLNFANLGAQTFKTREHPLSNGLFQETVITAVAAEETFSVEYTLPETKEVLALWISSDGDDTQSSFSVNLSRISVD